jgi:L-rhamnose mutarotase
VKRVCFVLNVKPDKLDDYRTRHREVWPEMRHALAQAGWRDYSLFLREDGLLVGYLVTDDFDRARAAIKSMPVNERWQETVKSLFESIDSYPDDVMQPLDEVFHLD